MLALVCQYAHLKVDTLAHWQPLEITQCRSDGVVLAGADDQASRCILYGLQTLYLVACDTDKRAVAVVQSAVYERLDECFTTVFVIVCRLFYYYLLLLLQTLYFTELTARLLFCFSNFCFYFLDTCSILRWRRSVFNTR